MEKKNWFVFNIGFNQTNPDHVRVANILNQLGHGKAEYLARAVLFFEENQEKTGNMSAKIDYDKIRVIVLKILSEQREINMENPLRASPMQDERTYQNEQEKVEKSDIKNILQALDSFRN